VLLTRMWDSLRGSR